MSFNLPPGASQSDIDNQVLPDAPPCPTHGDQYMEYTDKRLGTFWEPVWVCRHYDEARDNFDCDFWVLA